MKNMIKLGLISLVLMLSVMGCSRNAPLMNIPSQEVAAKKTNEDVFNAIKRAGVGLGWIINKTSDNTATGTLNLRSHQAVVSIDYSTKNYSITYYSSKELNYSGIKNTIHSNYNGWIQNLNNAIKVQLSL